MKASRLALWALPGLCLAAALAAFAPVRANHEAALRLVVPFEAGGHADAAARLIAQHLSAALKRRVQVDHRPGAPAAIVAEAAAADAAGLWWWQAATHSLDPSILARARGAEPAGPLISEPLLIAAHPSFEAADMAGLVALARSARRAVKVGAAAPGSVPQVAARLLGWLADAPFEVVAHRDDAAALRAVLTGQADLAIDRLGVLLPHVRDGRLKPLGITGLERSALLPDVPVVAATLPDYDLRVWGGIALPAGLPRETRMQIAAALAALGEQHSLRRSLAGLGLLIEALPAQPHDRLHRPWPAAATIATIVE